MFDIKLEAGREFEDGRQLSVLLGERFEIRIQYWNQVYYFESVAEIIHFTRIKVYKLINAACIKIRLDAKIQRKNFVELE